MGIFPFAAGLVTDLLKLVLPGHVLDWIPSSLDSVVGLVVKVVNGIV